MDPAPLVNKPYGRDRRWTVNKWIIRKCAVLDNNHGMCEREASLDEETWEDFQTYIRVKSEVKKEHGLWGAKGSGDVSRKRKCKWRGSEVGKSLECSHRVQFSSVAQSCLTLCDPMNRSTPGLPVHHQLPEFTETHVHRVSDAISPSHPLSSPSPPAPNPSQHQSLFQWVNSSHEVAKVLEFQLQHNSLQRNPIGLEDLWSEGQASYRVGVGRRDETF